MWKSLHSLNLMLPKEERKALLLRLFNDETPLININQKQGMTEPKPNGEESKTERRESVGQMKNSSSPDVKIHEESVGEDEEEGEKEAVDEQEPGKAGPEV